MKRITENGGLFYRSSRDGYGFEEDWAEVYTSKNLPPESYQSAHQSVAIRYRSVWFMP
ncbi:major tail fiber protein [Escherichia coli]|nr:major tail fiber protein [Escherichia coli]